MTNATNIIEDTAWADEDWDNVKPITWDEYLASVDPAAKAALRIAEIRAEFRQIRDELSDATDAELDRYRGRIQAHMAELASIKAAAASLCN